MRIIVADDEENALRQLVGKVKAVAKEDEIYAFDDPDEVLEFAKDGSIDVAFLDIEMGYMSGLEVAKQLKVLYPSVNVIFVSAYNQYMDKAFKLHISGYLLKPADEADIREELENLRVPVMPMEDNILVAKCFGEFETYVNGETLKFERSKTKELLAYLVNKKGNSISEDELERVLCDDAIVNEKMGKYLIKLRKDLVETLKNAGVADVFIYEKKQYSIDAGKISCDYYDFIDGKPEGIKAYNGEYMKQYIWAVNILNAK